MSSWREQHVLRMPATTIGIHINEEWNAFYSEKQSLFTSKSR